MEKKTNDNQKPANIWVSSAREFGQLRNIVFCGVMGALSVVLSFVGSIRINPYMKIGVSEIPNLMIDYLMGPVVGGVFGAVMDFIYKKKITFWRLLISEILVKLIVNIGMNTLWLDMLYGKGFLAILPHRIVSNLIQLPIDVIVLFAVLSAVEKGAKKYWVNQE